MAAIHDPVPGFNDRLARPVDRFFDRVEAGRLYMRLNWSVMDDPALFQPAGHGRAGHDPAITAEKAGEMPWLRIQRQPFGRLPESGAPAFGMRQIRRASCRARVCQSVSISVDAVSVNKNIKINKK